jgi:hypothetical protein
VCTFYDIVVRDSTGNAGDTHIAGDVPGILRAPSDSCYRCRFVASDRVVAGLDALKGETAADPSFKGDCQRGHPRDTPYIFTLIKCSSHSGKRHFLGCLARLKLSKMYAKHSISYSMHTLIDFSKLIDDADDIFVGFSAIVET